MPVRVRFLPADREIRARIGETVLAVSRRAAIQLNASCGGDGTCGTCKVRIVEGCVEGGEHSKLLATEARQGFRLACTARVVGNVAVEIPATSMLDRHGIGRGRTGTGGRVLRAVEAEGLVGGLRIDPVVKKLPVSLEPPNRHDTLPDLDRLLLGLKKRHGIVPVGVSFAAVKNLPHILRASDWTATAILIHLRDTDREAERYRLTQVEGGDTSADNHALVVDVGTTTLAVQLIDLSTGAVLATATAYNPQVSYGDDVISRLQQAAKPSGLEVLQKSVVDGINALIDELLETSGVSRGGVNHVVVAGNSTMTQIFLGMDPRSIQRAPYVTTVSSIPIARAAGLGLHLGDHVPVWCFPIVASWVGGDVVAGVLGSGMWRCEATTLLIDLGTNGEIVLGNRDWLVTTSCSAGPAFEGGGIRCGMRAATGAIEAVRIDSVSGAPRVRTIGNETPRGICGSGLISAVGELFQRGILAPNGRYQDEVSSPRLRPSEHGGREYVLATREETSSGAEIVLTEADVDNLVRAKAAIYAGCRVLLDSVGMTFEDVDQVALAGGFGQSLHLRDALRIGLLPPLPEDRFLFIGNGALLGGRLVSLSRSFFDTAHEVAAKMTHVDLADNPAFMDQYVAACFLPHTNHSRETDTA